MPTVLGHRWFLLAFCAAAFASACLASAAPAVGARDSGRLIVGFKPGAGAAEKEAALARGGRVVRRLATGAALVEPRRGLRAGSIVSMARDDAVAYVEPDYLVHAERAPNDPLYADQWHLANTGQAGGRAGADIGAGPAWDALTGGPAIVAILDSGADVRHPDLRPNLWANPGEKPNGRDDDANGFVDDLNGADFSTSAHPANNCDTDLRPKAPDGDPDDQNGHGTHLAGIIGAAGNNALGLSGVSWTGVQLMPLKFLDGCGDGTTSDAVDAIGYARAHGATILNASWGGPEKSQALRAAIEDGTSAFVFMTAAGNGGTDGKSDDIDLPGTPLTPDFDEYPAEFGLANTITVTASNRSDGLPSYANFGGGSVDIAAPGDEILSTLPGGKYGLQTGTSMAAAVASGGAALVAAAHPGISVADLKARLLANADSVNSLFARVAGSRRLNVNKALGLSPPPGGAPPTPPGGPEKTGGRGLSGEVGSGPGSFRLLRPANGSRRRSHSVGFRWQRPRSAEGIREFRLYVDGRLRKVRRDPDGATGTKVPAVTARLKLRRGRHSWYVKALDFTGKKSRSPVARAGRRAAFRFTITR